MSHYVLERDRLAKRIGNLEVEICVDVAVEIEFALFVKLHDRGPGEELRNRTGTKQGLLRRDGLFALHVGVTVAFREEQLSILHDGNRRARYVVAAEL